tara:strand:+ start:1252 stop:2268 length:1017 start_codon:yes stop_codon:yes gene_type:complete
MKVLVTGSAGFIGYHLTKALLNNGLKVVGVDNLNSYYDINLKNDRLKELLNFSKNRNCENHYKFIKKDICDYESLKEIFFKEKFDVVINLAAQAGVRYSIENPRVYIDSNLVGFSNILECCRIFKIQHLMFASSSSVYGMNKMQPFSTSDITDYPISLYAATKKSNELLAYSYSHLYSIPSTGLRFFTVYGPYGRPDMAYFKFTEAISQGKDIDLFNNGSMERDFTYVDDVVESLLRLIKLAPKPQDNLITNSKAPYKIYNIGNNTPVKLQSFVEAIEKSLNKKAKKNYLPMQDGDVPKTFANVDELIDVCNFQPNTPIEDGISKFVDWYIMYTNKRK